MNNLSVPEYFIADLPPGAEIRPELISDACETLKRNRERYLNKKSISRIIRALDAVASKWCEPGYRHREAALAYGPEITRFSRETLEAGLDAFFSGINSETLNSLIEQDLGHPRRLERWISEEFETTMQRKGIARGPMLITHFTAGNLPVSSFMSIITGCLVRAAQVVKCASNSSILTRLFAHSIYEEDPKLGACLEVVEWPGGSRELEEPLFAESDCITASGADETIEDIGNRLRQGTRFIGYGHRVSFAYITKAALETYDARDLAEKTAYDIAAWDQQGCLSPHVVYVERGGDATPEEFAELLAGALEQLEKIQPRGKLTERESADISVRRSFYQVRAQVLPDTLYWFSRGSTAWTVVYEANPIFQHSCLNRFIYVKGIDDLEQALHASEKIRTKTSAVGLAAAPEELEETALHLANWGVTRICPLGKMQLPPVTWRHDGRPQLADLITWTELEK
ncbi:MAG: hypothetical protein K9N52_05595 [Verrucomicrobia bacterium]|nr:hypothetical protein [Verrucomicrobiota bacterium]